MPSPVIRPHVMLVIQGAQPVELYKTELAALASQSEAFESLRTLHRAPRQLLENDIEALLEQEEFDGASAAWRFIQTANSFLGPCFYAVTAQATVATCGSTTATVTAEGFELQDENNRIKFTAIETTKTRTVLIREDGHETGQLNEEQIALAQELSNGNEYVTAVPARFDLAIQQPLYRLRARLIHAEGLSVLAT